MVSAYGERLEGARRGFGVSPADDGVVGSHRARVPGARADCLEGALRRVGLPELVVG